jgi:hypothetical protein
MRHLWPLQVATLTTKQTMKIIIILYIAASALALGFLSHDLKRAESNIEILAKVLKNHQDSLSDHRTVILGLLDKRKNSFM